MFATVVTFAARISAIAAWGCMIVFAVAMMSDRPEGLAALAVSIGMIIVTVGLTPAVAYAAFRIIDFRDHHKSA